jgi:hypothetical protein
LTTLQTGYKLIDDKQLQIDYKLIDYKYKCYRVGLFTEQQQVDLQQAGYKLMTAKLIDYYWLHSYKLTAYNLPSNPNPNVSKLDYSYNWQMDYKNWMTSGLPNPNPNVSKPNNWLQQLQLKNELSA